MTLLRRTVHAPELDRPPPRPAADSAPRQAASPPYPPKEPTTLELAANFAEAMLQWKRAGFATVSPEDYEIRDAACSSCEFWDAAAWFGTGGCRRCGCSRLKRWLASAKCPHPEGSRWPDRAGGQ